MTAPVFVVGPEVLTGASEGAVLALQGPEGRHAVSVRRLRPGEEVVLTDGAGTGARGAVSAVSGKDRLEVSVAELLREPVPRPRITVVQALPKGDRGEVAVETMTETGVDAIVPWAASRCVTRWKGERGAKALSRWRTAAREAGKQSRRLRFPDIAEPATTREVLPLLEAAGFAAVLHEEGSEPLAKALLPVFGASAEEARDGRGPRAASDGLVLVVGPEGGITREELDAFAAAGARPYRLGPSVLRTSTAGTAAAALLLGRTGRWD